MKVLIVAEGAHEHHGALKVIVERVVGRELDCDHDQICNSRIHAHHGKGQGLFKRAVRWCLEAEKRNYDAMILLTDHDGRDERIKELDSAQSHNLGIQRRALGIAIRTFDAWILADETAISAVLSGPVSRSPNIEGIKNPKDEARKLIHQSELAIAQREFYRRVCERLDVATLEQRSPRGFAVFANRIRSLGL